MVFIIWYRGRGEGIVKEYWDFWDWVINKKGFVIIKIKEGESEGIKMKILLWNFYSNFIDVIFGLYMRKLRLKG